MKPHVTRRQFICDSAVGAAALALGTVPLSAAESQATPIGNEAQLFLDDWIIAESHGLKRTLHQPCKKGLIREANGADWQRGSGSVVRDCRGGFHMVYSFLWEDPSVRDLDPQIGNDKAHWFRRTYAYAQSDDGIRWRKPILGLIDGPTGFRRAPQERWADGVFFEPTGFSKENNLGCPVASIQDLGTFGGVVDPKRRYLVNVVYRADTHNWGPITDAGVYFAADVPDIVGDPQWRDYLEPVWVGADRGPRGETTCVSGYDRNERLWFVCCQDRLGNWRKRGGRDIARFTSGDLKNWSYEGLVLPVADDESRQTDDWVEYMDMTAFRTGDVWLGQLVIFHGDHSSPQYEAPMLKDVWRKGTTELRLVTSRDAGKTWQRVADKQIWLPHHENEDGYDRLAFGGAPVRVGDELWLYYSAFDGDHLVWNRDGTTYYKERTRIGRTALATLRWDGYVSLDAAETPGGLLTRPLYFHGDHIEVNLAAPDGWLKAELVNDARQPIDGFTLGDCVPVKGNGVAQRVQWRSEPSLASASNRSVQIRFQLSGASLYSFRIV